MVSVSLFLFNLKREGKTCVDLSIHLFSMVGDADDGNGGNGGDDGDDDIEGVEGVDGIDDDDDGGDGVDEWMDGWMNGTTIDIGKRLKQREV